MKSKIDVLLNEELNRKFKQLKETQGGTEEYTKKVSETTQLLDRAIELQKAKNDNVDKWVRNGLTLLTFVTTTGVTIWGTCAAFHFDAKGTITSSVGRKYIDKLFKQN